MDKTVDEIIDDIDNVLEPVVGCPTIHRPDERVRVDYDTPYDIPYDIPDWIIINNSELLTHTITFVAINTGEVTNEGTEGNEDKKIPPFYSKYIFQSKLPLVNSTRINPKLFNSNRKALQQTYRRYYGRQNC